jgi:hypothetical protein
MHAIFLLLVAAPVAVAQHLAKPGGAHAPPPPAPPAPPCDCGMANWHATPSCGTTCQWLLECPSTHVVEATFSRTGLASGEGEVVRVFDNADGTGAPALSVDASHLPETTNSTREGATSTMTVQLTIEAADHDHSRWWPSFSTGHVCHSRCQDVTCGGRGECVPETGTCVCEPGFEGDDCEVDVDDCAMQPCLHGGACTDGVAGFSCQCATGYYGAACEIDFDECYSSPCENGGVCVDSSTNPRVAGQAYWCECASGFAGEECEIDEDECADDPCEHGGWCKDRVDGFECGCRAPWSGDTCESLGWQVPFILGALFVIVTFAGLDGCMWAWARCERVQAERAAAGVEFNAKEVLLDSAEPKCCNWRMTERGCWPGSCDAWCLALKILLSGIQRKGATAEASDDSAPDIERGGAAGRKNNKSSKGKSKSKSKKKEGSSGEAGAKKDRPSGDKSGAKR